MHVAYVSPGNLGPYHLPRFAALARLGVTLTVVRVPSRERYRPWRADPGEDQAYRLIPPLPDPPDPGLLTRRGLSALLGQLRPDALVVVGYRPQAYRLAAWWGKRRGIPVVLVCDSWRGSQRRGPVREVAKALSVRLLYDAAFVSGQLSAAYLGALGMPASRTWRGCDVVDNAYFARQAARARAASQAFRDAHGLPERYFLYCGRLSAEKDVCGLLDAFGAYRARGGDWDLVIVGSGPQEGELQVRAASMDGAVRVLPWVERAQIAAVYALAQCLVLPSRSETWGLVVNEAMACGLPVLVSRQCGCCPELCWRGVNGYDFSPGDAEALARLMLHVSSGEVDLARMGRASRRIVSAYTPQTWAAALSDCVATLCAVRGGARGRLR